MRPASFLAYVPVLLVMPAPAPADTLPAGVAYTEYSISGPNKVYVVAVDLGHPEFKLEVGWPQQKRNFTSLATTSSIANAYNNPAGNHAVIAATNGSYFGVPPDVVGWPVASRGEILQRPNSQWDTVYFGPSRQPGYEAEILSTQGSQGHLTLANGTVLPLQRYNVTADTINNTAFTPQWDSTTHTTGQANTAEIVLSNVSYPMRSGKEVSGMVSAMKAGTLGSNSSIPAGGMVIFIGFDSAPTVLSHTAIGDRSRMRFATSSEGMNNADMAITGLGSIIHNGIANTSRWLTRPDGQTPFNRQPMTILAYNNTTLFLVVCDGRGCNGTVGMTFPDMVTFLTGTLGALDAIDMDGGGSSTMWLSGSIKNMPSDGGCTTERSIASAILLVNQNTLTAFPFSDPFPSTGRLAGWDDKFNYADIMAFSPTSTGGDGYVIKVGAPGSSLDTMRRGDFGDANYSVQSDIFCEYRPADAGDGHERYALFSRDSGTGSLGLSTFGGGNCYAMVYDSDTGRVGTGKYVNGAFTDLMSGGPINITSSGWHRFRLDTYCSRVRCWLDGSVITDVTDTTFAHGYFGLGYQPFFATSSNIHGTRADNFTAFANGNAFPPDMDQDGDVDQSDFGIFQTCLSGPLPQNAPSCALARIDADAYVDSTDLALFLGCMKGANIPLDPNCAAVP